MPSADRQAPALDPALNLSHGVVQLKEPEPDPVPLESVKPVPEQGVVAETLSGQAFMRFAQCLPLQASRLVAGEVDYQPARIRWPPDLQPAVMGDRLDTRNADTQSAVTVGGLYAELSPQLTGQPDRGDSALSARTRVIGEFPRVTGCAVSADQALSSNRRYFGSRASISCWRSATRPVKCSSTFRYSWEVMPTTFCSLARRRLAGPVYPEYEQDIFRGIQFLVRQSPD